jgi:sRNA-binding carbon storage regulator CsrA|tara:strand:+ start:375 stop:566 length:192 start_codon:yes stop_codon:yes gene_type:complete
MLVLTVRDEGRVNLTDEQGRVSTVILIRTLDGKAKLGFDFPKDVSILRGEVAAKVQHDEQQAR